MKIKTTRTHKLVLCAMFCALIAVGAFIKIPIPVLPFTLQTLFIMLAGLTLGKSGGAYSALSYMLLGLMGLPIFTQGGGLGYILKPTFGYIIGFVWGAYVIGMIAYKVKKPSFLRLIFANFAGLAVIYAIGMIYFYCISNFYLGNEMGVQALFLYCFLMTMPGDILLSILAAASAKRIISVYGA